MKQIKLYILLSLVFLLTGCTTAKDSTNSNESSKKKVIATTTMIADLATVIGGDTLIVEGLMGPGIDPHLYQASAGDVTKMQSSDIIIYNGYDLEGKLGDIFASLSSLGKTIISLEDGIETSKLLPLEEDSSMYDPHIWFDVSLWMDAAEYVMKELSTADPENASTYQNNYDAYKIELEELHSYILENVSKLDESKRVLVTAHDAFGYFGKAYGFNVLGLQGISTSAEASTSDMRELSDFIYENNIPAIFIETSIPTKNIEALKDAVESKGGTIVIGGELYSDSLGDKEHNTHTYLLTVRSNIDTILSGLNK